MSLEHVCDVCHKEFGNDQRCYCSHCSSVMPAHTVAKLLTAIAPTAAAYADLPANIRKLWDELNRAVKDEC